MAHQIVIAAAADDDGRSGGVRQGGCYPGGVDDGQSGGVRRDGCYPVGVDDGVGEAAQPTVADCHPQEKADWENVHGMAIFLESYAIPPNDASWILLGRNGNASEKSCHEDTHYQGDDAGGGLHGKEVDPGDGHCAACLQEDADCER